MPVCPSGGKIHDYCGLPIIDIESSIVVIDVFFDLKEFVIFNLCQELVYGKETVMYKSKAADENADDSSDSADDAYNELYNR